MVAIFGKIEVDMSSTGPCTLTLATDLPIWAVRETKNIPATFTRQHVHARLQGTTKGRQYVLKIAIPVGVHVTLYGARIWARVLTPGAPSSWRWYKVPVIESPDEWTPVKLPIPETGEWAPVKLPIPETGEWVAEKLPIKPTPQNPEWVDIPVDQ